MHLATRRVLGLGLLVHALGACASLPERPSEPNPAFYAIEGGRGFLFGTLHLPDPALQALPPEVDGALARAAVLYTEVRFDAQAFARVRAEIGPVPPLAERLEPELLGRLLRFLAARGVEPRAIEPQPTWAIAALLPVLDRLGTREGPATLDQSLATRASAAGLELRALEEPEEQIRVFESLAAAAQVAMLRDTLDALEGEGAVPGQPLDGLVEAWRAGDEERLLELTEASFSNGGPWGDEFLERLLHERSAAMAERIAGHLAAEPDRVHFFAIGVGHLPGPRGVVEELRRAGLRVERR